MKVTRKDNKTLIISGHSWLLFVLLVGLLCATPFFIWLSLLLQNMDLLIASVVLPPGILLGYRAYFKNWQLVLEADYAKGALYSGPWLSRQKPYHFDLHNLDEALVHTKEVYYRDRKYRERHHTEYRLALKFHNQGRPLLIALGHRGRVSTAAYNINRWLERSRHPETAPHPNDSDIDSQLRQA